VRPMTRISSTCNTEPLPQFHFWCIQSNQSRSRLFLKKSRTSLHFPLQSRSETALVGAPLLNKNKAHKVLATSRALDRSRDNITDCVDLRAAQGPNLQRWLRMEAADSPQVR
jgi:hypothetical protein